MKKLTPHNKLFYLGNLAILLLFSGGLYATPTLDGLEIVCRPPVSTTTQPGTCGYYDLFIEEPFVTNEGCGNLTITNNAPDYFPLGITTITWTITDDCGNTETCDQDISIWDGEPPVITCPPVISLAAQDDCTVNFELEEPTVSDNCPSPVSVTNDAPAEFPIGITIVKWTAIDGAGNISTCTQEVNVIDNTGPDFLFCPNGIMVATIDCNDVEVYWDFPFVADNCGESTITSNYEAGSPFPVGTTEVIFTATDLYGNSSQCSFNVTVIPGTAGGADGFIECTENVTATAICDEAVAVTWDDPIPNSNCYGDLYANYESGSLFEPGETEVTYTLVDYNGNEYYCSFTVEVLVGPGGGPNGIISCPPDVFADASCQENVQVFWDEPILISSCYEELTVDYQSGDYFIPGTHIVTYTLNDLIGEEHTCTFKVVVQTDLSIYCPRDIEVHVPNSESDYSFFWNGSEGITGCELCPPEEDLEGGLEYIGTYFGHRYYFLAGDPISWDEASQIATDNGGYLVSINTEKEAEFLATNINNNQQFFIGLSDVTGNGDYEWQDGTSLNFTDWVDGVPTDIPGNDVVILEDSAWTNQMDIILKRRFIVEVPCVEFELINGMGNGSDFPLGTTSMQYIATDMCGNICECDFNVSVQHEDAEYDFVSGIYSHHHIKGFKFVGSTGNKTNNDGGYGDYTDINVLIPYDFPKFRLKPDRNPDQDNLYFRIWIDLNQDGDFEDENEVVFEQQGPNGFVELLTLPDDPSLIGLETRMRIGMSEFIWPEPYGFSYVGEFEDYTCTFVIPDDADGGIDQQAPIHFGFDDDLFPTTQLSPEEFLVFPNPTNSDRIYIQNPQHAGKTANITIYNQLGQVIAGQQFDELTADPAMISLPGNLSNGIYVMMIQLQGQEVISETFVLER